MKKVMCVCLLWVIFSIVSCQGEKEEVVQEKSFKYKYEMLALMLIGVLYFYYRNGERNNRIIL